MQYKQHPQAETYVTDSNQNMRRKKNTLRVYRLFVRIDAKLLLRENKTNIQRGKETVL